MGILEVLTIIFVLLKAFDVIAWSWWFVFSPLYVYVVVFVIWLMFALVALVTGATVSKDIRKKRK